MSSRKLGSAILAFGSIVAGTSSARADYTFRDLGPASGSAMSGAAILGNAINGSGMVAGTESQSPRTAAFSVAPGSTMLAVATLGGNSNTANGINNLGQITGASQTLTGAMHAYLTGANGGIRDLGTLTGSGSSTGYAVNASGVVVGQSSVAGGQHAFIDDARGMRDLNPLGGTTSAAYAINGSGHVVGMSQVSGVSHGFYYDGQVVHDIGKFGGEQGITAEGINASNHVVGFGTDGSGNSRAFIDTNPGVANSMKALSVGASVLSSFAYGINDNDYVVGEIELQGNVDHAVMWTPTGAMIDLNSLIPPGSNFVLDDATSINDAGEITGYYTINPGTFGAKTHAFLLGPSGMVPAPPSVVLVLIGGLGSAAGLLRRRLQGRTN